MKLDVRAAAVAAGVTAALAYALCTLFCVLVPESTVAYLGTVFLHVDLTGLFRQIGWGSFVAGALGSGLGTAAVVGAAAWFYNRLARTEAGGPPTAGQQELVATGRVP